jgi:hypothetical protein
MARTFIRQATQIRRSDLYDDTIVPNLVNYETNPVTVEDDLNAIRSYLSELRDVQAGNWYDALSAPVTFEGGAARGVQDVNQDLHDLERKRVLVQVAKVNDFAVPAGQNYSVLDAGPGDLPPNTTAAIGAVTTLGTVGATATSFGSHNLDEVAGATAVSPKNLMVIVDGSTRDPILSDGRVVYGLYQFESSTDGSTISTTTPNRAQISFVRVNSTGDDLEACPVADIEGKAINVSFVERKALEDLNEQDFLNGAIVDVPAGSTVTRQAAYDNQGTTPVDLNTNATLDLEGAGLVWSIRDDLEATLLSITEGSAGGTSTVALGADVDTFDVNAAVNDFSAGVTVNSAGSGIGLGVSNGVIESNAGDLRVLGAAELFLDDGNRTGSTWAGSGILLSDTTAEWDAFEAAFGGEVSLLSAITSAASSGGRGTKTYANVTVTTTANNDVGGVGGGTNLDAQLPDMSGGTFLTDYDVFLNGELLRPGADASANNDYYPGTSLANGQLRFEFTCTIGDVICVIPY